MADQYRLISGSHMMGKTKYTEGDVIETDLPLCDMFKNKFEQIESLHVKQVADDVQIVDDELDVEEDIAIKYELDETASGWFNVINSETKTAINSKKLRKSEAEELLNSLNG